MSAYKVTDEKLRIIAFAACHDKYFSYVFRGKVRKLSLTDLDRVCTLLGAENDKSLRCRYPSDFKTLGASDRVQTVLFGGDGGVSNTDEIRRGGDVTGFAFFYKHAAASRYDATDVCKAVWCYEYQSCEHDAWSLSEAAAICTAVVTRYAKIAMRDR